MSYANPYDIANRALLHCGTRLITTFSDNSRQAVYTGAAYDKLRPAELRSRLWKFALRTIPLRAITTSTKVLTFPAYAGGTTYAAGNVVTDNGYDGNSYPWISLQGSNTGNTPKSSPTYWEQYCGPVTAETWSSSVTYYIGDVVLKTATYYISTTDSNLNNDPASGSPWVALTSTTGATIFLPRTVTQNKSGTSLSAYRLPASFLRMAPQDAKAAGTSYSATSAGMQYTDMEIRGNYILTASSSPLIFRFMADMQAVAEMDPLFCDVLAAQIAMAVDGPLTMGQNRQAIGAYYTGRMALAGKLNAIEQGNTEEGEEGFQISRDPDDLVGRQQGNR